MIKPDKQNDIILLSNRLLNEKPRFTLFEFRIFYSFLYRQDRNAENFSEIQIPVREFISDWNLKSNKVYKMIEQCVNSMPKELFSKLTYDLVNKIIIGKFSENVEADILKQRKNFTKLYFSDFVKLSSAARYKLYEMMREYQNIGNRTFVADEMISLLSEKEIYKKNKSEFERRVLNPAVEQINKNTNLFVSVKKQGRGENREYIFFIKDQSEDNPEKTAEKPVNEEVKNPVCEAVLNYLNERAKTNYKYSEDNCKYIKKWIDEGFTLDDFKKVINIKISDWEDNEEMSGFIRPSTLFGKKFEEYLNQRCTEQMSPDDPYLLQVQDYFASGADYVNEILSKNKECE